MRSVSYLATSDGRWLPAEDSDLLEIIGDPEPNFDPVGFVVRNLGFIQYDEIGDSFAQITLFPKRVSLMALDLVSDRILSRPGSFFRIDHLDSQTKRWEQHLAMNPREAVGRLNELCGAYVPAPKDPSYNVEPRDLGAIMADETHPAHSFLRKWRSSFYRFDETVLPFMTRNGLDTMSMIIGVDPKHPEPTFRHIGSGFWGFENDFFLRGVGEKVENQPDKEYGQWVAPFYSETAMTWRPRFDKCTATINRSRRGHRYHYERLILPWSTRSGEVLLTLSSRFIAVEGAPSTEPPTPEKPVAKKAARSA